MHHINTSLVNQVCIAKHTSLLREEMIQKKIRERVCLNKNLVLGGGSEQFLFSFLQEAKIKCGKD